MIFAISLFEIFLQGGNYEPLSFIVLLLCNRVCFDIILYYATYNLKIIESISCMKLYFTSHLVMRLL